MKLKTTSFAIAIFGTFLTAGYSDTKKNEGTLPEGFVKENTEFIEGWPSPGPYDEVSLKTYPAYNSARSKTRMPMYPAGKLYYYVSRSGFSMNAPYEVPVEGEGGKMEMKSLGFIYTESGEGSQEEMYNDIEVVRVPETTVFSYTWKGAADDKAMKIARAALDAKLKETGQTATEFRLFLYNTTARAEEVRTHELLAVLPAKEESADKK